MKVRLAKFFRFKKILRQGESIEEAVTLEIPNQRMLCTFTLEEAAALYFDLDEAYTRARRLKHATVDIAMPKVEQLVRVTNMELLMGMGRGEGSVEETAEPVEVFKENVSGGYVFASQEGLSKFIESIEKYVQEKVEQEVAKRIGGIV